MRNRLFKIESVLTRAQEGIPVGIVYVTFM